MMLLCCYFIETFLPSVCNSIVRDKYAPEMPPNLNVLPIDTHCHYEDIQQSLYLHTGLQMICIQVEQ